VPSLTGLAANWPPVTKTVPSALAWHPHTGEQFVATNVEVPVFDGFE
jgi:hypothetical protein